MDKTTAAPRQNGCSRVNGVVEGYYFSLALATSRCEMIAKGEGRLDESFFFDRPLAGMPWRSRRGEDGERGEHTREAVTLMDALS